MASFALPGLSLLTKGLGAIFKHRAQKKAGAEQLRAAKAGAGLGESARQDRLAAAQSLLARLGSGQGAYSGGADIGTPINTSGLQLSPEVFARLAQRRNVESAVVDPTKGLGSAGLAGALGSVGAGIGGLSPRPGSTAAGGPLQAAEGGTGSLSGVPGLSIDDLQKLISPAGGSSGLEG